MQTRPTTIYGGEFKYGNAYGSLAQRYAERDLIDNGFLVFSVDHREAPNGQIHNQREHTGCQRPYGTGCDHPEDGRPSQQSDDIKRQIMAARHDARCNGIVFVLGGSSGGTHALWCALDPAPTVPGWGPSEIPQAVVALSAPCDLSSREGDNQQDIDQFDRDVRNYTNTQDDPDGLYYQYGVSPISLVADASNIPPIRLFATEGDSVPHQQAESMAQTLSDAGADVVEHTILGSDLHSFDYWHTRESTNGIYVNKDVVTFFQSVLP